MGFLCAFSLGLKNGIIGVFPYMAYNLVEHNFLKCSLSMFEILQISSKHQ